MATLNELELYTIPFSHFCDLGRWSLQASGVPFVEKAYLPGIHMLFSPTTKLRGDGQTSLPILCRTTKSWLPMWPITECVARSSWDCVAFSGVGQVQPRVAELLDSKVGPAVRMLIYSFLLTDAGDEQMRKMCMHTTIPWWQRRLWGLKPFRDTVRKKMAEGFSIHDETALKQRLEDLDTAVSEIETILDSAGLLNSPLPQGQLDANQLAVAAILAPGVLAPEYFVPFFGEDLLPIEAVPKHVRDHVERLRSTRLGKLALAMYATRRLQSGSSK